MDWLKNNYEKVILAIASVLALTFAIIYILRVTKFAQQFKEKAYVEKSDFDDTYYEEVYQSNRLVGSKGFWRRVENNKAPKGVQLTSGPLMLDDDEKLILIGGDETDADIFEDSGDDIDYDLDWFIKYDLDFLDRKILKKDSDLDGFTNKEEYIAKTHPKDPDSFPPLRSRLRYVGSEKEDYILRFSTYNEPDIGINRVRPNSRSRLDLRIGSAFFNDKRFVVLNYEKKMGFDEKLGIERNVSEVTIQDTFNDRKHTLVYGANYNIPTYTAKISFRLKDELIINKKADENFSLPQEPNIVYTVKEVNDEKIILSFIPLDEKGNALEEVSFELPFQSE